MKRRLLFVWWLILGVICVLLLTLSIASAGYSGGSSLQQGIAQLAERLTGLRWWLTGLRTVVMAVVVWQWRRLVCWVYPETVERYLCRRGELMRWRWKIVVGFVIVEALLVHNVLSVISKGIL